MWSRLGRRHRFGRELAEEGAELKVVHEEVGDERNEQTRATPERISLEDMIHAHCRQLQHCQHCDQLDALHDRGRYQPRAASDVELVDEDVENATTVDDGEECAEVGVDQVEVECVRVRVG